MTPTLMRRAALALLLCAPLALARGVTPDIQADRYAPDSPTRLRP